MLTEREKLIFEKWYAKASLGAKLNYWLTKADIR